GGRGFAVFAFVGEFLAFFAFDRGVGAFFDRAARVGIVDRVRDVDFLHVPFVRVVDRDRPGDQPVAVRSFVVLDDDRVFEGRALSLGVRLLFFVDLLFDFPFEGALERRFGALRRGQVRRRGLFVDRAWNDPAGCFLLPERGALVRVVDVQRDELIRGGRGA